jgi:predicted DNA-binding antitoxin AbrB/MazE fold protein
MTYHGTVKNGVVVLEPGVLLPEGSKVKVERVDQQDVDSLREGLLQFAGSVKGLPADSSRNHDHYLYGTDKK